MDAVFYVRVVVLIPTLVIGSSLSGLVLATFALHRRSLVTSTLDSVLVLLTTVILIWAVASLVRFSLDAFNPILLSQAYCRVDAALSYVATVWLIVSNILLALSRYFVFKEKTDEAVESNFKGIILMAAIASVALVAVCFSVPETPNRFGISYLESSVNQGVVAGMSLAIMGGVCLVIGVYYLTFRQMSRNLEASWTTNLELRIRILLQKKAFKTCFAMSACTVISYLPIGIALLASLAFEDGLRAYPLWLIVCASELVLLDTVWSPLMLLVFMPRVRRCLFRMLRILDHDANETNSSTDEEEDEREAIELSIPG